MRGQLLLHWLLHWRTSQPLRKRFQQHTSGSSVSAVFDHLKASGHKTDLEEVNIIDRETRWFERGVKEAIWVRAENPSLNRSGGVRIKLSHAWDRTITALPRKLTSSLTSDDVTSGESPESRSTTSVPSWKVVVPPGTSVCSEKCKSGWQDLFLTHLTSEIIISCDSAKDYNVFSIFKCFVDLISV